MNKIINGKKYNTETATRIASHYYYNNGNWSYSTHLYKKRTGEYFFHIDAGGSSDYHAPESRIDPIEEEGEAKLFCEDNLSVEAYEKLFGVVEE